jgi:hypothetical protein
LPRIFLSRYFNWFCKEIYYANLIDLTARLVLLLNPLDIEPNDIYNLSYCFWIDFIFILFFNWDVYIERSSNTY